MNEASIKIPSELFALAESSHFEGELHLASLEAGPDDYCFQDPVSWEAEVTNTGAAFLISGTAKATGTCACARCLEDVTVDFIGDIEAYLLIEGVDASDFEDDDDAPGDDEFEVLPADHIVDLEPFIRAALVMDAPNQPLCRDDCAGLCPNCGANLNEGPCSCDGDAALADFEAAANPFSALAGLNLD